MNGSRNHTIIDLLQETEAKTLVLTCMDFQVKLSNLTNEHVSVMSVLGIDLERCCPETLEAIGSRINSQGIEQLIILEHHSSKVHKDLLTDFDKKARWSDLAEKLRETRLELHTDGVSLMENTKYAHSHARKQLNFMEEFLRKYFVDMVFDRPLLRGIIVDPSFGYKELIKIEITSFKN